MWTGVRARVGRVRHDGDTRIGGCRPAREIPAGACPPGAATRCDRYGLRLVYVDGNAPARIGRRIQRMIRRHGDTLIRTDWYLRPTHARNLGFREVDTRYAVFLDNDVVVTPGWLEALVRCAEETGAAFVSPVICIEIGRASCRER